MSEFLGYTIGKVAFIQKNFTFPKKQAPYRWQHSHG
jgi:hypothetical protein